MSIDKKLAQKVRTLRGRHNTIKYVIERAQKDDNHKINVFIDIPFNLRYAVLGDLAQPAYEVALMKSIKTVIDTLQENTNATN